jgi:hypothetical protein
MAVTAALSPSSFPQSSTGRFEVTNVLARSLAHEIRCQAPHRRKSRLSPTPHASRLQTKDRLSSSAKSRIAVR